ncbi:MAG: hypothetical protein IJE01_01620 [Clostridia bacterium]|nr:hypothetical protein [Clostridia bacterium]
MKSVLMSVQPYWVFLIIAQKMGWKIGEEKTVEVRKNCPKDDKWDKGVNIYCTKDKKSFARIPKEYQPLMEKFLGKVIGEFVCDEVDTIQKRGVGNCFDYCYLNLNEWGNDDIEIEILDIKKSCVSKEELNLYGQNVYRLYAWHISNLVIYNNPRELGEFYVSVKDHWETYDPNKYINGCWQKPLTRPPQSWCYVESEVITNEQI